MGRGRVGPWVASGCGRVRKVCMGGFRVHCRVVGVQEGLVGLGEQVESVEGELEGLRELAVSTRGWWSLKGFGGIRRANMDNRGSLFPPLPNQALSLAP